MQPGKPKISFTFPYRWINDPKDKPYLSQNWAAQIKKGGLQEIYQTSMTDGWFAANQRFVQGYYVVLKYHAFQPVKIKLKKEDVEEALKTFFPDSKCVGFQTFFVQKPSNQGLPVMELEIYY